MHDICKIHRDRIVLSISTIENAQQSFDVMKDSYVRRQASHSYALAVVHRSIIQESEAKIVDERLDASCI